MEVKNRTEEQIKARVAKLGLKAASGASPLPSEGGSEGAGGSGLDDGSSDDDAKADETASGRDDGTTAEDTAPASPIRARKIESKSQAQSDDDSEGLFSAAEVRA